MDLYNFVAILRFVKQLRSEQNCRMLKIFPYYLLKSNLQTGIIESTGKIGNQSIMRILACSLVMSHYCITLAVVFIHLHLTQ